MSKSSTQKDETFLSALTAYLDGAPCPLSKAITTTFIHAFGTFLADRHDKHYSPSTCREILRTLRMYLRLAILDGTVPNIDNVPAVIRSLDAEYWADSPAATPDTSQRQDLKVRESISSVMRHLDFWTTKRKMTPAPKTADRADRTEALHTKCAAIYLFCILTYGIDIKDALAIKRDWAGSQIPDSVYIERYGMRLPLSRSAKALVETYNSGATCTSHLFFTLDNNKYKGDLDRAAALIDDHIAKYFTQRRLPLFAKRSVFTDWLNYALESGLPDADAETLWLHRLGDIPVAAAMPALQSAQARLSAVGHTIDESWYLLSILSLTIKRDSFMKILLSSGILGQETESRRRIYAPEEKLSAADRSQHAVLGRYIFFRGTPIQAEFANTFSPYAYVIKDMARKGFARIHESELRDLQVMLRDFPDAVELVDGEKWLQEHNAKIVEGCKAVIRSGSLIGKEAKVVSIKGKKDAKPVYIIEYIQGAIKFRTALEGVHLDILPA